MSYSILVVFYLFFRSRRKRGGVTDVDFYWITKDEELVIGKRNYKARKLNFLSQMFHQLFINRLLARLNLLFDLDTKFNLLYDCSLTNCFYILLDAPSTFFLYITRTRMNTATEQQNVNLLSLRVQALILISLKHLFL